MRPGGVVVVGCPWVLTLGANRLEFGYGNIGA
jgi:hypothetical protein